MLQNILLCTFTYLSKFSFWFILSIAEQGFGIITLLLCAFKMLESLHNAHICQLFLRFSKVKYSAKVQFEQTYMPTALLGRFGKVSLVRRFTRCLLLPLYRGHLGSPMLPRIT